VLSAEEFKGVAQRTPLIALDLVAHNAEGRILVGKRRNSPAKGFWFVPGGRVFKDERLEVALGRVSLAELGVALTPERVRMIGAFDHIYPDNFFDEPGWGFHYIVLALRVLDPIEREPPDVQHSEYRFVAPEELRGAEDVHPFTKSYFEENPFNLGFAVR
jgi:colanic acid biosynthesis protein WcaH